MFSLCCSFIELDWLVKFSFIAWALSRFAVWSTLLLVSLALEVIWSFPLSTAALSWFLWVVVWSFLADILLAAVLLLDDTMLSFFFRALAMLLLAVPFACLATFLLTFLVFLAIPFATPFIAEVNLPIFIYFCWKSTAPSRSRRTVNVFCQISINITCIS